MLPYPLKLRLFVQQQRSTDCDHESTQAALSMSQNEKGKEKACSFLGQGIRRSSSRRFGAARGENPGATWRCSNKPLPIPTNGTSLGDAEQGVQIGQWFAAGGRHVILRCKQTKKGRVHQKLHGCRRHSPIAGRDIPACSPCQEKTPPKSFTTSELPAPVRLLCCAKLHCPR